MRRSTLVQLRSAISSRHASRTPNDRDTVFLASSLRQLRLPTNGVPAMIDHPAKDVLSAMSEDAKKGPLARPLLLARVIAISAAVAGAVPTAMNFYHSWKHDIPYSQVSHRLTQYDLWVKNFECKIDYKAISTAQGTKVDVGACPKSGDIAIKLTASNGKAAYEWIAAENLQKSSKAAASALLSLIVSPAVAEEIPKAGAVTPSAPPRNVQLSQSSIQVVCQSMPTKSQIIRIVNEGGKCFRETVSPFAGKVDKREEVPCNTACPAPAKT